MPSIARSESPLSATAEAVARSLGAPETHRRALVVASPLAADVAAPRGDELAVKLASLVASALGGDAVAEEHVLGLAAARARTHAPGHPRKVESIVFLDVRVASGELRVTTDVFPVLTNRWDRVRLPAPAASAHAYAHATVTAEVRSYLAPVQLDRVTLKKFTHYVAQQGPGGRVLALACGDLDGDGGNDLVVVSERGVAWGHLQGGRFVATRSAPASALARRAPVPWREPSATSTLEVDAAGAGTLLVGWSDRLGVLTGPDLSTHRPLSGMPLTFASRAAACARPRPAEGAFESALVGCADAKPLATTPGLPPLVDALVGVDLVGPDGRASRFVAARDLGETLHLVHVGTTEALTVHDVGAQIALGDLDQDGVVEVITTEPRGDDALVLSSWRGGALVPRQRWPAPLGVDAVAVCPAEAGDAPSLVAAVGPELWLVH